MKLILVLGGARSGKSNFAKKIILDNYEGPATFLATARPGDEEMRRRISLHKKERPATWSTWEGNPSYLIDFLYTVSGAALMDCLTTWLSELIFDKYDDMEKLSEDEWSAAQKNLLRKVEELCKVTGPEVLVIVSNEIGMGIAPAFIMGRRFRDLQGRANQMVASRAESVAMMIAGLPLWLKGGRVE